MKKFFGAQSTLEFIMLLILVLAGIFVMGPYVVRAVNAYMHSWESSADQSNSMVQIPPWELDPNQLMPCNLVNCDGYDGNNCTVGINRQNCCMYIYKYNDFNNAQSCQSAGGGCTKKSTAQAGVSCCNISHNAGNHNHLCSYGGYSGIFDQNPGDPVYGGAWGEDKCDCQNTPPPDPCENCTGGTANGYCDTNENNTSCPYDPNNGKFCDCGCGNGHCDHTETATSCPADCSYCAGTTLCAGHQGTDDQGSPYQTCVSGHGNNQSGQSCCIWRRPFSCNNSTHQCVLPPGATRTCIKRDMIDNYYYLYGSNIYDYKLSCANNGWCN